jgi:hypothetical protein
MAVARTTDDIYRSPYGDRWWLIRDAESGLALVRHEANPTSGGQVTETDVDEFLNKGGSGPEYAALRHLIYER